MKTIAELCKTYTTLTDEDIAIIEDIARHLQFMADICQADVFIDCPTEDPDRAVVVAQASPTTARSLYRSSVVGHMALSRNEPAVQFGLVTGLPVVKHRGVSQEGTAMQQNVIPIKNRQGVTIGVLIKEEDITEQIEQEKQVELLLETTGQLSDTLLRAAMAENQVPSLMHEGMILIDEKDRVRYANARAVEIFQHIGIRHSIKGESARRLFDGDWSLAGLQHRGGMRFEEMKIAGKIILLKAVLIYGKQKPLGAIILIRDITELKEKEKQLLIKSAVIKEIHHRVKNNLQMISSLIRMQMRRSDSMEVRTVFRESINRINCIAVIHEILAQDGLETVNFRDILDKLSRTVVASLAAPDQCIEISFDGMFMELPPDKATTLSLIVTELLQNSIIHGFKNADRGRITITCLRPQERVVLTVTDDGCGIGYDGYRSRSDHLGLKIVETLVTNDLEGQLYFKDNGNGTTVMITFPWDGVMTGEPIQHSDADDEPVIRYN